MAKKRKNKITTIKALRETLGMSIEELAKKYASMVDGDKDLVKEMKLKFEYIENQNINDIFGNLNKEVNSLDGYIVVVVTDAKGKKHTLFNGK